MRPVFEPLDKDDEFRQRINESFPSVYLTFISIIQGVALGILASQTFAYMNDPNLIEPWINYLPYSAVSFIIIIIVAYEYTWLVGVFRWSPRIWDTVIPFVLGLSEISPMFYLTNPKIWWLLNGWFCFFGFLAFANTLWRCKEPMFGDNTNAYKRTKKYVKTDMVVALMVATICIVVYLLAYKNILLDCIEISAIIIFILLTFSMMYRHEKFMKALHDDFGFNR